MNITAIIGVGIVGALLAITVKNTRPELGLCIGIGTGCVIFSFVLPHISEVLAEVKTLSEKSGVEFGYFVPIVKIIGIAYITQFSSEIIKDSGENAIAKKVEFAGKIAILLMMLPILKTLISTILGTLAVL